MVGIPQFIPQFLCEKFNGVVCFLIGHLHVVLEILAVELGHYEKMNK